MEVAASKQRNVMGRIAIRLYKKKKIKLVNFHSV
jgi:hypothetical protein